MGAGILFPSSPPVDNLQSDAVVNLPDGVGRGLCGRIRVVKIVSAFGLVTHGGGNTSAV